MAAMCCALIDVNQDASKLKEIQKAVGLLSMNAQTPKSMEDARRKHYQFWDTQPVPKLGTRLILQTYSSTLPGVECYNEYQLSGQVTCT